MHLHSPLAYRFRNSLRQDSTNKHRSFVIKNDRLASGHAIDKRRVFITTIHPGKRCFIYSVVVPRFRDRIPRIVYSRRSWIGRRGRREERRKVFTGLSPIYRGCRRADCTIHTWRTHVSLRSAHACGAARARVSVAFSADRNTETLERVRARAPRESTTYHRVRTKPTRHWMRTGNRFVDVPPSPEERGAGKGVREGERPARRAR